MAEDDDKNGGWKPVVGVTGGDEYARGVVQPVYGKEGHPCFLCRSFEKPDLEKMIRHMMTRRDAIQPEMLADGRIRVRPAEVATTLDILDPKDYGWCRLEARAVEHEATCGAWEQKRTRRDF